MRVHKSSALIIMFFLFIILVILHLSSCRHISWGGKEEMEERTRTRFLSSFPKAFGTNYHTTEVKANQVSGFHTVKHTATPGGPNPLHNWVKIVIMKFLVKLDLVLEGIGIFLEVEINYLRNHNGASVCIIKGCYFLWHMHNKAYILHLSLENCLYLSG